MELLSVAPHLQRVQCSSSERCWGEQCGGQPCLRSGCSHQALTVDEEVDQGEGVRTLHQNYRLGPVVQSYLVVLFTPSKSDTHSYPNENGLPKTVKW